MKHSVSSAILILITNKKYKNNAKYVFTLNRLSKWKKVVKVPKKNKKSNLHMNNNIKLKFLKKQTEMIMLLEK